MESFLSQFRFQPSRRGAIGVEREFFLATDDGALVPESPKFLGLVNDPAWTYELSACQVEHRTAPCPDLDLLMRELRKGSVQGQLAARKMGRRLLIQEVGPPDMPLNVYPDEPRYLRIVEKLSLPVLAAACQVTAVHVHIGVASIEEALLVHNRLADFLDIFLTLGDHSAGERFKLYMKVAPRWQPPRYQSVAHFHQVAEEQEFLQNPRDCWHMIRLSRHGTVEVRAFGMTDDLKEIVAWAAMVRGIAFRAGF